MALTPAELVALSRLLDDSLELPANEREPWLAALPASQQPLVPQLREMLQQADEPAADGALASPPRLDPLRDDDAVAREGERVGPYRLLREIGRGGMGSVWLAERADGSYERRVALKLPRLAWGAGLAERMARERDIGARLEHASIARLYDAGVDERGRPYLAMEFIDGQPIDAWCEARSLGVRERLRLFVQVARAVAYAHGRLVVHRDLKPSNVLVSADGQAHLLDFGIAKLLHDAQGDDPSITQDLGRVLTPHYASPEQIRGEAITVASDVYSLGVLLYELLCGHLPYAPDRPGLGALEQAILDAEPPLASSRATSKAVAGKLKGEIDAILTKALKRDTLLRYATADALADDLDRYLCGETVLAQPDNFSYRLIKIVRRHRWPVGAAAAVLVALVSGAAVAVVQARRAEVAAERARAVKEFVVDVFKVNERGNPANRELRQLPIEFSLEHGARLIEAKFAGDLAMQAELYGVVAGLFADMANRKLAEQYARRQLAALEQLGAPGDAQARALVVIANSLTGQRRLVEAEAIARRAVERAHGWPDESVNARLALVDALNVQSRDSELLTELDRIDADLEARQKGESIQAVRSRITRAILMSFRGQFENAVPIFDLAIDIALRIDGALSRLAATTRVFVARQYIVRRDLESARRYLAPGLAALRARGGIDELSAANDESLLTLEMSIDIINGKRQLPYEEARVTIERLRAQLIEKDPRVPALMRAQMDFRLGILLFSWGEVAKGAALTLPAIEVMRSAWADYPWGMQMTASRLALMSMIMGDHARAGVLFDEAVEHGKTARRYPLGDVHIARARNLWMQHRFDDAAGVLDAAMPEGRDPGADPNQWPAADTIQLARAALMLERGNARDALALLPESTSGFAGDFAMDPGLLRSAALCAAGRARDGLPALEARLAEASREHATIHPELAWWLSRAGICALDAGQRKRAKELYELSFAALNQQPGVSPYFKQPLKQLAARLGKATAVSN